MFDLYLAKLSSGAHNVHMSRREICLSINYVSSIIDKPSLCCFLMPAWP